VVGAVVTSVRSRAEEVEDHGVMWDVAFHTGGQRLRSAHDLLIQKEERA
jgi:hypothetical protein